MKRVCALIAIATTLVQVAPAQDREFEDVWRAWNTSLARPLQELITKRSINYHPPRPMSRAEFGVMTWQLVQIAEATGDSRFELNSESRVEWAKGLSTYFWRIELLVDRHWDVFSSFGIEPEEVRTRLDRGRSGLKRLGIGRVNSIFDRFSDVPQGHWADDAFHNLRKAGILVGFPDNTIRP